MNEEGLDYLGAGTAPDGGGWWVDQYGRRVGWSRLEDTEMFRLATSIPPGWDYLGRDEALNGGWWVDKYGNRVGFSREEDSEILPVRGPAGDMRQLRVITGALMAEAFDAPPDEFVQEVVLSTGSGELIVVEPAEPPILTFGPEVWTLINGTYTTTDDRGRTALAVGQGDPSPGSWTKFSAPCVITASSDWTVVVTATGEINDDYTATIVEENGGGGIELKVTEAVGLDEGDIISGSAVAPNAQAFSPAITTYRAVHEAGATAVQIGSTTWGTGSGTGATGAGTVIVTLPPDVALFGLWIYDYPLEA